MEHPDEHLATRVYWYPRGGGEARMVEGNYLNNWSRPTLACGLGELVEHLELELVGDDYERVQDDVNRQLEHQDFAVVDMCGGCARIEAVGWRRGG